MTIDEAIRHCVEVAEENETVANTRTFEDGYTKEHRQLAEWLKELKRLREQTEWISCSKRIPEKSGVYIVTEKEYSVDDRERTGRFNLITEPVEFYDGKWKRASFYEVMAWKPLPKPYKEESEGEEDEL